MCQRERTQKRVSRYLLQPVDFMKKRRVQSMVLPQVGLGQLPDESGQVSQALVAAALGGGQYVQGGPVGGGRQQASGHVEGG